MGKLMLAAVLLVLTPIRGVADNLYKVRLLSPGDADLLRASGAEALIRLGNEYLLLANDSAAAYLQQNALDYTLILKDVAATQLAVDQRPDGSNVGRYYLVYEHAGIRVYRMETEELGAAVRAGDLLALADRRARIVYSRDREPLSVQTALTTQLDSLVSRVLHDSIESCLYRLQAFQGRVAGTDSNRAARDWIRSRFESYGYDSVRIDTFWGRVNDVWKECYNVVAVKPGALHPDSHVVVGAHYDGVPGSPAADDNGSGTTGVLEISRVLAGIPNDVTLIFVAFDAEESGLWGAFDYVDRAVMRGEDIKVMFNMDMIASQNNNDRVKLHYGPDSSFAVEWKAIASPLVALDGALSGMYGGSDHWPFYQNGNDVVYLREYRRSGAYHSVHDSIVYCDFDYTTRIIKASLGLIYAISTSVDLDADGVANAADNCLVTSNSDQTNSDGDPWGDACDNCPVIANAGQENQDGDAWGDVCDNCVAEPTPGNVTIHTGDLDYNGIIQSSDIICSVNFVFKGGPEPLPTKACGDVNCDGNTTSADVIGLVNYVFKSGVPPCDVCQR